MSTYADLATIARDASARGGFKVEFRDGWDDNRKRAAGSWYPSDGFLIHHLAGVGDGAVEWCGGDSPSYPYRPIPAIQYVARRDGTLVVIYGEKCYHAGKGGPQTLAGRYIPKDAGNSHFVGVEIESRGTHAVISETDDRGFTPEQVNTVKHLAAAWCRHYDRPVAAIEGHKDWAPRRKIDPIWGSAAAWRKEVAKVLSAPVVGPGGGRGTAKPTPPKPAASNPAPDFNVSIAKLKHLFETGGSDPCILPIKRTLERHFGMPQYALGKGPVASKKLRDAWVRWERELGLQANAVPQSASVRALTKLNPKITVTR